MAYHHVIAKVGAEDKWRVLFSDLSEDQLKKCFIRAYASGKQFLSGHEVVASQDLRSVQIVRTEGTEQVVRDRINEEDLAHIRKLNSTGDLVIISPGRGYEPEDILDAGADVTSTYIKGPPSYSPRWWTSSMKVLAWLAGIVAVAVAAGIVKWLGWS